ncbi:MAG: hypothetical protein IJI83_05345 [Oscillospiraceae bacterium]|nr:hypothetical protein [Oscillospiraceae bacterium]
MNKEAIQRLIYLRGQLENRIDNIITEYYMRGKELSTNRIKDTLDYCIEDALRALKEGR